MTEDSIVCEGMLEPQTTGGTSRYCVLLAGHQQKVFTKTIPCNHHNKPLWRRQRVTSHFKVEELKMGLGGGHNCVARGQAGKRQR